MVVNQKLGIEVPERQQLAGVCAEIRELVDAIENGTVLKRKGEPDVEIPGAHALIRLAAAARRDGFPTSSMQGSSRSSVLDEDGFAVAPISDPTGELAAGERIVDPIKVHLKSMMRGLTDAQGALRTAKFSLIQSSQYAEVGVGEARCSECERIGEWSDVFRDGRCSWCYKFWLIWKRDPPIEILKARKDGRKITRQIVIEAFAPSKTRTRHG